MLLQIPPLVRLGSKCYHGWDFYHAWVQMLLQMGPLLQLGPIITLVPSTAFGNITMGHFQNFHFQNKAKCKNPFLCK